MAITYHAGRRIQGLTQDTSLDGTNDGCTTGVTGKLGNAWSFDGSNDKVTLTPTFSGKSAFTYSAWINPSSSSNNWAFPFYEGSGENPKVGIGLDYYNSNGLAYFYVSTASHSAISISASNIPKGSWTHVTGVYDGSASSSDRLKFYINGSLVSSTLSGTPPTTIPTLGGDLYLGWYQANYWFNGLMDQTLFYDKALSASEISTIYNSGSGTTTPDTVELFAHYNFEQTGNTLVNQVTVGDVKPTNAQVGSRFEETDTRKMYSKQPNYKVHSFTSSGTFQITSGSGNTEVLVIAGGGGGVGNDAGGGGGAGGYSEKASHPVTAGSYTVTVGAGGSAGGVSPYAEVGTKGGDSSFDSIISDGGGAGVNNTSTSLINGGSGGGVRNGSSAGTATQGDTNGATGYGNAGADTGSSGTWGAGGGGGAGSAGSGASGSGSSGTYGGAGGNGKSNSITGTAVIYAGGGGGGGRPNSNSGAGGTGGGGTAKSAGTDGLGGGGGGGQSGLGGDGGDGIVIIKYADDGSITATGGTITTVSGTWKEKGTT